MTDTDRRAYILAATCEGCRKGLALGKVQPPFMERLAHNPNSHIESPCTANHALADEVEKWVVSARSQGYGEGHTEATLDANSLSWKDATK